MKMMLVNGDLQFLHLAHLPLQPVHLIETHAMPSCQGEGSRSWEGQLELRRGLEALGTHECLPMLLLLLGAALVRVLLLLPILVNYL